MDAAPPTVTLDLDVSQAFPGALLRDSGYTIAGNVRDAGDVARVDVCVDDVCGRAGIRSTAAAATPDVLVYADVPSAPQILNDATNCAAGQVVRTFSVAEDVTLSEVSVGVTARHERRDDLNAWLTSPSGTTMQILGGDDLSGTGPRHYDVLLRDAHPVGLHEATGDDVPTLPWFDRQARPLTPLQTFHGERSAGTWTLALCDDAAGADGAYERSRLVLTPRADAATNGTWTATAPGREPLDYVTQTVTISAVDGAGNRTPEPLNFAVTVDNVPPTVTVTDVAAGVVQTLTTRVLTGTVRDGGSIGGVHVSVEAPSGQRTMSPAVWADGLWTFEMATVYPGTYRLWPTAVDLAGNEATLDALEVVVTMPRGRHLTYLPVVARNYLSAPDLVVSAFAVSENALRVVVRNAGSVSAADPFWVDLYVDPDPVPTGVNQVWQDLADQGMVWGVTAPLAPGEVVTLTENGAFYWGEYSAVTWPLAQGTPVAVQVDSANAGSVDGGVREAHEILGEPTNNIAFTVVTTQPIPGTTVARSAAAVDQAPLLPPRPGQR